jgi:hypothetical protein
MKTAIAKLRAAFPSSTGENAAPQETTVEQTDAGKVDGELHKPDDVEDALVTESAQHGVQTVEATTLVWTRTTLAIVFVL